MHPVPVVYGLTIGEYGCMVNQEGWLANNLKCDFSVIKCLGYDHSSRYKLPIKPSPNLPNERSIELYPSLCFFEGTVVSAGRGTDYPFQLFGAPFYRTKVSFIPKPNEWLSPDKNKIELWEPNDIAFEKMGLDMGLKTTF